MIFNKHNPKALHLDGLDTATRKVTVGFKCNPKVKLRLAQEANKYGLTLSEYIETLLLEVEGVKQPEDKIVLGLMEKIAFYENDILKALFGEYEGKHYEFKNANGQDLNIKVTEPKDIYTIIINSYKINK